MKYALIFIPLFFFNLEAFSWGKTGHRVVGEIAYRHLSKKAKRKIRKLLAPEMLGMVGNFMDEIKSNPSYDSLGPWHYCTIPDGKSYQEVGTPENGDVIMAINLFIDQIESGGLSKDQEIFALKCLVHLIGDIHQPLHVGNGEDRGGNSIDVTYFWKSSNLHRVWDSGIIDQQQLSYSEYVNWIDHPTKDEVIHWQNDGLMTWVEESISYREQVYSLPENKKINYKYNYDNIEIINKRLLQAGIRLAGILNNLYG